MVCPKVALFVLVTVVATGCASTSAVPAPFPRPGGTGTSTGSAPAPAAGGPAVGTRTAYAITGTALSLRGAPYRNGGADPSGFDCSGFVYYVFRQHGVAVPRTVLEQSRAGRPVSQNQLEPGDLLFFSTVAAGPSHVAISIGGDEFVHAPSSVGQVRVERLSAAYWASRFVGARRVM